MDAVARGTVAPLRPFFFLPQLVQLHVICYRLICVGAHRSLDNELCAICFTIRDKCRVPLAHFTKVPHRRAVPAVQFLNKLFSCAFVPCQFFVMAMSL
ncbi:hypothetical protein EVA_08505 [gut metagenome]|uniref:Uncharacterized protein n=1 Tax=gut metagenome TaxID=749906 RepID=J9GSX2_9ZZZZ